MFCETCGQPLRPHARFCEACGQAAPAPEALPAATSASSPPPAPERPRPPRRVWLWLTGLAVLTAGGIMLASSYWGASRQVQPGRPETAATAQPSRPESLAGGGADHTITDVASWHHPVKDVLEKFKVAIHKVELRHNRTYPIFYVTFPYDPWFAHNNTFFRPLYYETLRANGFWDYSFVDESWQCTIHIAWDKKTKTMTERVD